MSRRIPDAVFSRARPGAGRAVLRVAVPERAIRMTLFGLQHVADPSSGWWRLVEKEVGAFVCAHLPSGAGHLEIRLDPDRMEIELEYDLAFRRGEP